MADNNLFKAFGFELKRSKAAGKEDDKATSIVPKVDEDGAGYVTASGSYFGQYVDMEGTAAKDNQELIIKYRGMAEHPECDAAIEDIINESIVTSELEASVSVNLDKVETTDKIKKTITEEFNNVISMLNFEEYGHEIFRSWYVDGRLYHHLVVNESNMKAGIQEVRPIDATKVRKVKEVQYKKDAKTGAKIVDKTNDFYIYQERAGANNGIKLTPDSISYVTSGLLDNSKKRVLSYLQKAMKPVNQLRMMEDSLVIYRMARAPERRIFYIDVGNMPKGKAEQHLKDIMARYRNKIVYDANSGEVKDGRKHMSMLEDFWLPRREGGRGTEISTLPGGENLGQIDDIIYFQKKLYRSLNVPMNRLEQENQFSLGRSTEINRDEVKFQKFIDRLRRKFSQLFLGILKKQLIMKGICTDQDWNDWKNQIQVDYTRDNHFSELKDAELLRERLQTMDQISSYVGEYFSREWVMKNVMMFNAEDIEEMSAQVEAENENGSDEEEEM
jgi:hypothetical protein|tara:strand:- start:8007 stop:9509 length:1503 start_codon:yes stop_codon:yes gene_type:complete